MTAPAAVRRTQARPSRRFTPLALFEALATPHGLDRYLELVNPMLTVRELRAEVTQVDRRGDTVRLTLRPTRQWRGFLAGQFVQLSVDIDGVRRTRCYSPCCSQHRADGRIELAVKAHSGGLVSSYLYARAAPGLIVGLTPAAGEFRLPAARPARLVLISGGSGVTPVLSMLRTLCDEGYEGELAFLHYARTELDICHLDELRALEAQHPAVRLAFSLTSDGDGADLRGHFTRDHLDAVAPWFADAETFVCGPPALMAAVDAVYAEAGLSSRLHTEEFTPVGTVGDTSATGSIAFERSATTTSNDGTTLLEQAEAAGLSPEFGCRMGICFSCTQIKTSGCTKNIRTGELNRDPDTELQLCINVAVGDVALDI